MSMKPRLSPCSRPRRMGVDSQPVGSGSAGSRLDQGLQERRPLLADPLPLFGFFSRLPVGSAAVEDVAAAFHLVPLVGWLSGGLGSLLLWVAWSFLPAEALAAVVLAFFVGLTGLNQTDGLLDLGDGLMVHGAADTRRQVMRDHVVGAGGVGLGLFTYLVSFACLTGVLRLAPRLGAERGVSAVYVMAGVVILSEVGARLPYLILARWGRPSHSGLGEMFMRGFSSRHLAVGVVCALPLMGLVVVLGWLPVALGLGAAAGTAAALLRVAHRHLDGVGGDVFGASQELARATILLAAVGALGVVVSWVVGPPTAACCSAPRPMCFRRTSFLTCSCLHRWWKILNSSCLRERWITSLPPRRSLFCEDLLRRVVAGSPCASLWT